MQIVFVVRESLQYESHVYVACCPSMLAAIKAKAEQVYRNFENSKQTNVEELKSIISKPKMKILDTKLMIMIANPERERV